MCASTIPDSRFRASSRGSLRYRRRSILIFELMYRSAWSWVRMPSASACSIDGMNMVSTSSSQPTICRMSWSLTTPIALNTTKSGQSSASVLCFM